MLSAAGTVPTVMSDPDRVAMGALRGRSGCAPSVTRR
jgi:hypothetical protein